ncbi:helix-turn-helix domain-containing protein [Kaistia sp. MMO-174]|uniref:helix-turn-helix domain-containing protein n=1 Tax=Kaistia sp. MMO-174 TaxID=3081256 RepID=UPI003FA5F287
MKLAAYLLTHRLTNDAFGAKVGASPAAVRKWRYGERIPRPEQMSRIAAATGGEVTAADFYVEQARAS